MGADGAAPLPRPGEGVHMREPRPVRLVPERDAEQVSPTVFRATKLEPWLWLDPSRPLRAGRWVRLEYRTNLASDPVRPVLRVHRRTGDFDDALLPAPVRGWGAWTGRIPEDAAALAISPVRGEGEFAMSVDRLRTVSRLRVIAGAFLHDPALTGHALLLRLVGRRARSHHLLRAARSSTPFRHYARWARDRGAVRLAEPDALLAATDAVAIDVLVAAERAGDDAIARTVGSLERQDHSNWGAWIVRDPLSATGPGETAQPNVHPGGRGAHRAALRANPETGESGGPAGPGPRSGWILTVRAGDILPPHALRCIAAGAVRQPAATAFLFDEDHIDAAGRRRDPLFRSGPSPRLLRAEGGPGDAAAIRIDMADAAIGFAAAGWAEALIGRALSIPDASVGHIRRVLLHRAAAPDPDIRNRWRSGRRSASIPAALRGWAAGIATALVRALPRLARVRAVTAAQEIADADAAARIAAWPLPEGAPVLPDPPVVSAIVAGAGQLPALRTTVEGLLGATDYPHLEIVVAGGGSDPASVAYCEALASRGAIRFVRERRTGPVALMSAGLGIATGRVLLFLDGGVAPIRPDWLARLMAELGDPRVGAVGARLLRPDGRVGSLGLVLGLCGRAGHIDRGADPSEPGWNGRLHLPHEVSAVGGACLAVRREAFEAAGGLAAAGVPDVLADVDLCLRLGQAGFRNLTIPAATLVVHHASGTGRERLRNDRDSSGFDERWADAMRDDPCFHPAFSLQRLRLHLG